MSVSSWNKSHALSFRGCPAGSTLFLLVVLATRMKPEYSEWSLQSRVFFTEYHPYLLNTIITYNYPASTYIYIYILYMHVILCCATVYYTNIFIHILHYIFFPHGTQGLPPRPGTQFCHLPKEAPPAKSGPSSSLYTLHSIVEHRAKKM